MSEPVCGYCGENFGGCDCDGFLPLRRGEITVMERLRQAGVIHRGFHPSAYDEDCEACRRAILAAAGCTPEQIEAQLATTARLLI